MVVHRESTNKLKLVVRLRLLLHFGETSEVEIKRTDVETKESDVENLTFIDLDGDGYDSAVV